MSSRHLGGRGRRPAWLAIGGIAAAGAMTIGAGIGTAGAAANPSAYFTLGVLTVVGTDQDDTITVSRDAAGAILVNGGTISVTGGTPTVANTRSITIIGAAGNDTLTMDEANGALPRAILLAGLGNDTATAGSGADLLIGQAGDDTLLGRGGQDRMFGNAGNDALIGGDADDQAFGEAGDDTMLWNPGDDTDLNEGGADSDTTVVNGGNGTEQFSTTANGTRVRFDRLDPAPFSVDMGTTEKLVLNANGGDDTHAATGNLAALVSMTLDGGAGNDSLLGGNGIDVMLGGEGDDFLDGQQGNDVAFLGDGADDFQWDPGDGSDVVEGQAGADSMLFNGSAGAENFETRANGGRILFTRNLGNIVMDLDDVERIDLNALAGADNLVVGDVSGSDLAQVDSDLSNPADGGTPDADADTVTVDGTNGDDVMAVAGAAGTMQVGGLAAQVNVTGANPAQDRVSINTRAGDDVLDASNVETGTALLSIDGGVDDDILIGGDGDDTIAGGEGDDVLIGGLGTDTLDGGPGDNVLIDGEIIVAGRVEGDQWLAEHTREESGRTVIEYQGHERLLPAADLTVEVPEVPEVPEMAEVAESAELAESVEVVQVLEMTEPPVQEPTP